MAERLGVTMLRAPGGEAVRGEGGLIVDLRADAGTALRPLPRVLSVF